MGRWALRVSTAGGGVGRDLYHFFRDSAGRRKEEGLGGSAELEAMPWCSAMGKAVAQVTVGDGMPAPWKKRRFARRTIPVDASPLKKTRCGALEDEDAAAAALPCVYRKRRFARRTIPVDASPVKKSRCEALEDEDAAAALPCVYRKRRFARRTIPVDASPLKKRRCGALEEEEDATPSVDSGELRGREEEVVQLDSPGRGNAYVFQKQIGKGGYGVVYRARERKTGDTVAVKKMKLDGAACSEIDILSSLPVHPCIVGLKEVVPDAPWGRISEVYLVMECVDADLLRVILTAEQPLSESTVKFLMHQLLRGVSFLHANGVLHRDLKPSNLLVSREGELKLCDFGLSRRCVDSIGKQQPYTNRVGTLWYRAPELLLMAEGYSAAVDMWSVGCIMAQLLAGTPLFPGRNELDQLNQIFSILGVPDEASWPTFASLCSKMNVDFTCNRGQPCSNKLKEKLPRSSLSEVGHDLLGLLLAYDPSRRLTAEEAVNHPWFMELPAPTGLRLLL